MFTGALRAEYRLRGAQSLKDKRQMVRSLKDRLSGRFGCAVAEVDLLDVRSRAVIGAVIVSGTEEHVRAMLDEMSRYARLDPAMECTGIERSIQSFSDRDPLDDEMTAPTDLLFTDMDSPETTP